MGGAFALFFGAVDESLHIARREHVVVYTRAFEQTLDQGKLVGRIEELEGLRQARIAMVRAQEAIAQAVECTHPHAPRIDGQQAGEAGKQLARDREMVGAGKSGSVRLEVAGGGRTKKNK